VVGGGSAAFEAAVAAKQAGAPKVVMLEKAPEPDSAQCALLAHRFRCVFRHEVRQFPGDRRRVFRRSICRPFGRIIYADLQRVTRGRINKELSEVLVSQSNSAMHWLRDLGINWEIDSHVIIDGRYYFEPGLVIHPTGGVGGGLGQLMQWREIATKLGIELRYESRVTAMLGNDRQINGVRVSDPNEEYEIQTHSLILCAGGFQASAEMRARYPGPPADLMRVRGSKHDTGEVFMMAIGMGEKTAGHWQGAHATPIDSTYPEVEIGSKANRYGYPYSFTVNTLGQRFFDEGEARHSYTYAKTGWAVLGQPGALAYQIYDQTTIPLLGNRYEFSTPIEANSIDELAGKIGIDPTILNHTVREFNNAARKDIAFDPKILDGKCTEGITPKKSNWAEPD
jgi:tricarballylate dehydrogenase